MTPHALSQFLLIVVIVALLFWGRRHRDHWQQLNRELLQRMPAFSAETTKGREAEFIRDRLPKRPSWMLYAVAASLAVVIVVLQWWYG